MRRTYELEKIIEIVVLLKQTPDGLKVTVYLEDGHALRMVLPLGIGQGRAIRILQRQVGPGLDQQVCDALLAFAAIPYGQDERRVAILRQEWTVGEGVKGGRVDRRVGGGTGGRDRAERGGARARRVSGEILRVHRHP